MTTYYVGPGGSDAANGTTWALRKLTLNGAEDIPVAAGDTVYVGPGTYRELLTVDVSGTSGNPISYIGDYSGALTDGVGGVVRITGSDNDQTATRANCVAANAKNYRTFTGFTLDTSTSHSMALVNPQNWIINQCHFLAQSAVVDCINCSGATQLALTIQNCFFMGTGGAYCLDFTHSATVDNTNHLIQNCVLLNSSGGTSVISIRVGGITIKNSTIMATTGVYVAVALTGGQLMTVNNCVVTYCSVGLRATTTAEFSEDYNNIFACSTARTNVNTGANSLAYPPLFDPRWFFELISGKGRMLSLFDLASYSQLVNVVGTSPTTTDMRGTAVIGAQREWGALEYDPAMLFRRVIGRHE